MRKYIMLVFSALVGVTTFMAVIAIVSAGLSFTGCDGDDGGTPNLTGTISISPNTDVMVGTELTAQWEYACRAGTTTAFNNGEQSLNNQVLLGGIGWFDFNSGDRTHQVGIKAPNAWGLYDMHGNVQEWCWDRYGVYPDNTETNPTGASSGTTRVFRGGAWSFSAQDVRSAFRNFNFPYYTDLPLVGFRLVRP